MILSVYKLSQNQIQSNIPNPKKIHKRKTENGEKNKEDEGNGAVKKRKRGKRIRGKGKKKKGKEGRKGGKGGWMNHEEYVMNKYYLQVSMYLLRMLYTLYCQLLVLWYILPMNTTTTHMHTAISIFFPLRLWYYD